MILRQLPRLRRALTIDVYHAPPSGSLLPIVHRDSIHSSPFAPGSHPKDPSPPSGHSLTEPQTRKPPLPPPPPPNDTDVAAPSVPTLQESKPPTYSHPPFHTHAFFAALEKTFPTPTARSLMRATRALLVDRIGRVRREGLTSKDLDNQAYLFRAALSELRQEVATGIKNDASSIVASTSTLRREVDKLDVKMKEDVSTLKHEIQMEVDNRKNEVKEEFKKHDIHMEEMLSKALVEISELRTRVEEVKWHNMQRGVVTLFSFVALTIVAMELQPKTTPTGPPQVSITRPSTSHNQVAPTSPINQADGGLERLDWVT